MLKTVLSILLVLSAVGCADQNVEKYEEKARNDGRAGAEGARKAEEEQVQRMEADLARLQNFYQGVSGTYEGKFEIKKIVYPIRFTVISTVPRYLGSRIRTVDEVSDEINRLALVITETTTLTSENGTSSMGCQYSDIKPFHHLGRIELTSKECARSFTLQLNDSQELSANDSEAAQQAQEIAGLVLENRWTEPLAFEVEARSIHLPSRYKFLIRK